MRLLQVVVLLAAGPQLAALWVGPGPRTGRTRTLRRLVTERGTDVELGDAFYREESAVSRDLAVLAAVLYKRSTGHLRVCDAYGGSGIRAARYLREAEADFVHCNDANEEMDALIRSNLERNAPEGAECIVTHTDSHRILYDYYAKRDFLDLIDADSFGLAGRIIGASLHAIRHGGLMYLCQTDGRCSGGHFPERSLACYGSWAVQHPSVNEQGLRMLLGAAAREAAMHSKSIEPVFSLFSAHGPVFRCMIRVHETTTKAPQPLKESYQFTAHCNDCGHSQVVAWEDLGQVACASCQRRNITLNGPTWVGPLHDQSALEEMALLSDEWEWDLRPLLETMMSEADPRLPPYFVKTHDLSRKAGVSPPPRDRVMEVLRGEGYITSRTHIDRGAFKTNADMAAAVAAAAQVANEALKKS